MYQKIYQWLLNCIDIKKNHSVSGGNIRYALRMSCEHEGAESHVWGNMPIQKGGMK